MSKKKDLEKMVKIQKATIKIWGHPHQCMSGIPVCWRCAETITEYMNKLKEDKI